jgi:CHAD domain-containing protein
VFTFVVYRARGVTGQGDENVAKQTDNGKGVFREEEVKLDAEPEFVLPDLAGLPGVARVVSGGTEVLEAVYVDSADLRLTRGGTTLRRRTGGSDAGWHLKLPEKDHGRLEVRRALGRSVRTVPPALLGLSRVQLRGEPVAPVARIETGRTEHSLVAEDGTVLAVVADDAVTAEALGDEVTVSRWRELEVELVDGDRALLEATVSALREAGARPAAAPSKLRRALAVRLDGEAAAPAKPPKRTTIGQVAVAHLREQVEALVAADPFVRVDAEDAVHQMRVSTRRLRSGLATFRPLFEPGSVEPLRAELKWLGEVLGRARDAEVIRDRLRADAAAQPAELLVGPVLRRIDLELRREHKEAHGAVVATLDDGRYLELVTALEAFVADPPLTERAANAPKPEAASLVRRSFRRVERAAAAVDAADAESGDSVGHDHPLHEVRKAAKRARYAAESVRPVVGKPAKQLARALEAVQETLGDHQDSVVERVWLRDLGMRAHLAGENGWTFGRLHGLAEARARHDEEVWEELRADVREAARRWPG